MGSSRVYVHGSPKVSCLFTKFGLSCAVDPTFFTDKTKGSIIILIVHMDDLLVTRSDEACI